MNYLFKFVSKFKFRYSLWFCYWIFWFHLVSNRSKSNLVILNISYIKSGSSCKCYFCWKFRCQSKTSDNDEFNFITRSICSLFRRKYWFWEWLQWMLLHFRLIFILLGKIYEKIGWSCNSNFYNSWEPRCRIWGFFLKVLKWFWWGLLYILLRLLLDTIKW